MPFGKKRIFYFLLKRYHLDHQNIIRHPGALTSSVHEAKSGSHPTTGTEIAAINGVGQSTDGRGPGQEQWVEGTVANKVVFLNTPPPPPQHMRLENIVTR